MNTIDAWLACDYDGLQWYFLGEPIKRLGRYYARRDRESLCRTSGHNINPGDCRPVKLRVEVVDAE